MFELSYKTCLQCLRTWLNTYRENYHYLPFGAYCTSGSVFNQFYLQTKHVFKNIFVFIRHAYTVSKKVFEQFQSSNCFLTHLRLASLLWDIGRQHSPRCDAAERGVPSGAILFAYRIFIKKWNKILKSHLRPLEMQVDSPKYDNDGKIHSSNMG